MPSTEKPFLISSPGSEESSYVVPKKKNASQANNLQSVISIYCDPAGTRTQGPNIKSVVLYQLSYEINLNSYLLPSVLYHPDGYRESYEIA
jgi:hypothetical protein